jgi:SAM-dependent methyltransferase
MRLARERVPAARFFQADARSLPFDREFDVVGAFDVLEHIEDDGAVLQQMYQASRPGGGILLTLPQHRFLWSYVDEYSFHKRRYSRREIVRKVQQAGFEVLHATSFVSLLLPAFVVARLRPRIPREEFDCCREFAVNRLLGIGLERVLDLERLLIGLGLSFPAGGSLLVVAGRGADAHLA